jgi:hypothetical protein
MGFAPDSPAPNGRLPALLRYAGRVEQVLAWLFAYPLFPLQVLILVLISWGGLGATLGLDDLFWHENRISQFLVGLACGLFLGLLLLVRYLLDRERDQFHFWFRYTLFPGADPAVARLGQFLLWFWPPLLLLLGIPKLFSADFWLGRETVAAWPLFAGLAASILVGTGLVLVFALTRLKSWLIDFRLFRRWLPAVRYGNIPDEELPLHALALWVGFLSLVGLVGVYVAYWIDFPGFQAFTPVVGLCFLLSFLNELYGFIAFQLRGIQYLVLVLLVVAGLLLSSELVDRDHAYKLRFPNMEDYYADVRTDGQEHFGTLVRLDEESKNGARGKNCYLDLLEAEATGKATAPSLIDSEEPLREMQQWWGGRQPPGKMDAKPRVMLIATSGGGIRAAVWTGVVLEGLEREIPHVRDHVRMIAGASGGMVGAALYVADFENTPVGQRSFDPVTGLGSTFAGALARDSLNPAVQTMFLSDLPSIWVPGAVSWDRGKALERAWHRNTPSDRLDGVSPLTRSFEELKDLERKGRRPSLVFSPMLVEDARRLLVSNLDVLDLTWSAGDTLDRDTLRKKYPGLPQIPDRPVLSLSAVEFFRLFPKARGFQVGTAARMSATFPVVSPAVSLPTYPPRRVVDAGYYDNYGADVLAEWVYLHRKALEKHTSGVAIVEIRAYRNGFARRNFQDREEERQRPDPNADRPRRSPGLLSQALSWLSSPAEAVLSARERMPYYRNDELLQILDRHFNTEQRPRFFTTVAFECEVDADLSWTLPTSQARNIAEAFYKDATHVGAGQRPTTMRPWIKKKIEALGAWLGPGGE